jgi:hypothetical protein
MLLFIDGFDSYGETNDASVAPTGIVSRKYSGIYAATVKEGRTAGKSLDITTGSIIKIFSTVDATVTLGVAINIPSIANSAMFIALYDNSTLGVYLSVSPTGVLTASYNGGSVSSSAGVFLAGNWYHVELQCTCDASAGSILVRLNGRTVIDESDLNTKIGSNSYHNGFALVRGGAYGNDIYCDDLYFLDSTGSANNDLLGDMKVETIRPSGAGGSSQWTPLSGDNYTNVSEVQCDDDTSYVECGTSGYEDLYAYGNLSSITGVIAGVQINTVAKATDASSVAIKFPCKSSTTDDGGGSDMTLSAGSYLAFNRIVENDPATSAAWLIAAVNDAQFGVKVG